MGSEDLHHKRKLAAQRSLVRTKNRRESYDLVLIVCEGEKTEPNYLRELCDDLQLNTANVKVLGLGKCPLRLVEYAIKEFECNNEYDTVYCVFDKDQHPTYLEALSKIESCRNKKKNNIPIYAITSVPCFEYWLLLHYKESTRPYKRTGNKSAGDLLFTEIKEHIREYRKGHENIYQVTKENIHTAIRRAKQVQNQQDQAGTDNPTTKMHLLVEYLMNLKK